MARITNQEAAAAASALTPSPRATGRVTNAEMASAASALPTMDDHADALHPVKGRVTNAEAAKAGQ